MGRGAFNGLWLIITKPHVVHKDVGLLQTSLRGERDDWSRIKNWRATLWRGQSTFLPNVTALVSFICQKIRVGMTCRFRCYEEILVQLSTADMKP